MVRWHHWHNGHEFEQTPGDSEGQGSLVCCSPWGCKEQDPTQLLNNSNNPQLECKLCGPRDLYLFFFFGCLGSVAACRVFIASCGIFCGSSQTLLLWCVGSRAPWRVGSQFPGQGWNPCPLHCKAEQEQQRIPTLSVHYCFPKHPEESAAHVDFVDIYHIKK